jgi:hypothetical protein
MRAYLGVVVGHLIAVEPQDFDAIKVLKGFKEMKNIAVASDVAKICCDSGETLQNGPSSKFNLRASVAYDADYLDIWAQP